MKAFLVLLIAVVASTSFSQKTTVKGKIINPTGEWVYLQKPELQENGRYYSVIFDSTKLEKGAFEFEFTLDSLTNITLYDGNEFAFMYLKPGEHIGVELNPSFFDESLRFYGDGASRNSCVKSFTLINDHFFYPVYEALEKKAEEIDTTATFKKMDEMMEEYMAYIGECEKEFPELDRYLKSQRTSVDYQFASMKKRVRTNIAFEKMVGEQFVNFKGHDLAGGDIELSAFYGEPILLDFWATWCGPCKREMPYLQEIEKSHGEKVNIVSVGLWCEEEGWQKMASDYGFENNMFLNEEQAKELQEKYFLNFIPRYILLDEEGVIVDVAAERPSGELTNQLNTYLSAR